MDITTINKNFRIVFQEKRDPSQPRARYAIGAGRLHAYIGEDLAIKCFKRALKGKGDKTEINLRKQGKLIFYNK